MSATEVVYYVIAVFAIVSALGVVLSGNIVHAAIFFILSLGGVAGFYLILTVEFLALVQLVVYGGAVTILILFALMLTRARERPQALFGKTRPIGTVAAMALLAAFIGAAVSTDWFEPAAGEQIEPVPFQLLGDVIFTVWIVPFILIGILLSIALDGAVLLALPDEEEE
ncbi:MAG: NADH-quinone oxidoreductase subunit J [Chloroflexi bacterium]|nr:NADH-quinone oxidoreductase subunit J [Chloroflexota bacterium]MCZ6708437.1 NADH-quinone oxidoreductase subunit J [Chloroflexota bacterium]